MCRKLFLAAAVCSVLMLAGAVAALGYATTDGGRAPAELRDQTGVNVEVTEKEVIVTTSYTPETKNPPGTTPVGLVVGGKPVRIVNDVQPFVNPQGITMIPARTLAALLGASIAYDGAKQQITIQQGLKTIVFNINSNTVLVDGKAITLETSATLFADRTFVPLRFITEAFGNQVDYAGGVVTIK